MQNLLEEVGMYNVCMLSSVLQHCWFGDRREHLTQKSLPSSITVPPKFLFCGYLAQPAEVVLPCRVYGMKEIKIIYSTVGGLVDVSVKVFHVQAAYFRAGKEAGERHGRKREVVGTAGKT